MQTLPGTVYGAAEAFAPTHWSVVVAAATKDVDTEAAHAALAQLCETYWPPLYTFVRARGHARHDAQDLTQGFFAYLLEHRIYAQADPEKGKFRSFLLASLKHFLADARDREQAQKRGGGREFVPLDETKAEATEALFQTRYAAGSSVCMEDWIYERTWAETLITTALERLTASYRGEGKQSTFEQFRVFLAIGAAPLPSYAELASRLGLAESSVRSQVTRLRARYRELLREEVRRTVRTEAEVNGELRELLRALTA